MVKISVLMPVYNTKEKYLHSAIESILNQTYKDYEFLILNDCSTDENVEKIVKSYGDVRIKYIKNSENLGISLTRNKLVDLSLGEYLAVMDHDDISHFERLEKQVKFLDENSDYGVVGSWHGIIGKKTQKKLPIKNDDIQRTLFTKCCLCHPATMIRKSVFINNSVRYNKIYSPSEDYALWAELVGKTKFYNIPEVLFYYRDYQNNTTHKKHNEMSEATFRIKKIMMINNPEQWEKIKYYIKYISKIKLFGKLTFLTKETYMNKSKYKFFGAITIFTITEKYKLK